MTQKELVTEYVKLVSKCLEDGTGTVKMKVKLEDIPRGLKQDNEKVCDRLKAGLKKSTGVYFIIDDDVDYDKKGNMTIESHILTSLFIDYCFIQDLFDDYMLKNIECVEKDWRKSNRLKLVIPLIANGPLACTYKPTLLKMLKEDLKREDLKLTYNLKTNKSKETKTWFIEIS